MIEPTLSILIPCVRKHEFFLEQLLEELNEQIKPFPNRVEILVDKNEKDSTGKKRNRLLENARGKYIVFIDADDEVFPCYIEEILIGAETDCDCMGMTGIMTTNGRNQIGWELSKDFQNNTVTRKGKPFYIRKTNHISPVKRELALQTMFPDISNAEDKDYSDRLNHLLKKEYKIIPLMYHYIFQTHNKTYQ